MSKAIISRLVVGFLTFVFLINVGAISFPLSVAAQSSVNLKQFVPSPNIGLYTCSAASPCPMGVTDYGVNNKAIYSYHATEFVSWANFTKLKIGGNHQMTVQQNTVDYGVYEAGKVSAISGEYWIQDVSEITQSGKSYSIQLLDNIWNFSSGSANMGGKVFGNTLGDCIQTGGQPTYYYCLGKQSITTTLPFSLEMVVTTGVLSSGVRAGSSVVTFQINVYHGSNLVGGAVFDEVAFNGVATGGAKPWYQVGGTNPFGLYNDAETVQCGPGGGSSAKILKVQAGMSEFYLPVGSGVLTPVPHAWSAGTDTAETVSGVQLAAGTTASGVNMGAAKSGTDNNIQLW